MMMAWQVTRQRLALSFPGHAFQVAAKAARCWGNPQPDRRHNPAGRLPRYSPARMGRRTTCTRSTRSSRPPRPAQSGTFATVDTRLIPSDVLVCPSPIRWHPRAHRYTAKARWRARTGSGSGPGRHA